MAAGDYSGRPESGRGAQRRRAGLWEAMDRTRIRWRNAARIAAGVAAAAVLALVVLGMAEVEHGVQRELYRRRVRATEAALVRAARSHGRTRSRGNVMQVWPPREGPLPTVRRRVRRH